jgi:hypothetical protein
MNETSTETHSVVIEREIPFPPEKMWRALTQPHLIEEWLMKNDFKPVVGHRFNLRADWGLLTVRSWQSSGTRGCLTRGVPMISTVSSPGLSPLRGTGSHLRMEQSGFRPDQPHEGAKGGWQRESKIAGNSLRQCSLIPRCSGYPRRGEFRRPGIEPPHAGSSLSRTRWASDLAIWLTSVSANGKGVSPNRSCGDSLLFALSPRWDPQPGS